MNKLLNILLILIILGYAGYYFYKKPKYTNGEKAPQFSATLIDGSSFELKDLEGSYVLIDFWGSWCGPCRKENPELVNLYHEFKDASFKDAQGFEMVSIAVETNEKRWKSAIEKDLLTWKYHIAQLERFKSPIVSQYGVKEIPTKYLLNERGEIIGVNLSAYEIAEMLRRRM
ncbi:MAG: TlpA family protein disulfide reductase [Saprospiraceae bacterium]|nr:TlpA family protein disulfide reductase [Saprospiraceae bacterium]